MEVFSGNAVVVGAGFSWSAGLPLTSGLSRHFLNLPPTFPTPPRVQEAISRQLRRFWEDVFGYEEGGAFPSFEDHFTALDHAANAGHNLGHYAPAQLRALRRLSIHRVFDIIDVSYNPSATINAFLVELAHHERTSIISTNWDVVVENHLLQARIPYSYQIPDYRDFGSASTTESIPLIKLHGSANWHYCDVCRNVSFGSEGKTALLFRTFLEARDFKALDETDVADEVEAIGLGGVPCHVCHNRRMSARVATFSYSKAFDFFLFHALWDKALSLLREAPFWTFIGYSLPDADFAFRDLLLTAAAASLQQGPKQVRVIALDESGAVRDRYSRFFGHRLVSFENSGFDAWVQTVHPQFDPAA
jgi:hypothetical protein